MGWGEFAGAGASLLGAGLTEGLSAYKMKKAYKYQRKLRKNMYQDTMFSMREAGLNPILAYKQGAPTGAVPPTAGADFAGAGRDAVNSALAVKMQRKQRNLLVEQTMAASEQGRKSGYEADILEPKAKLAREASKALGGLGGNDPNSAKTWWDNYKEGVEGVFDDLPNLFKKKDDVKSAREQKAERDLRRAREKDRKRGAGGRHPGYMYVPDRR